MKYVTLDNIIRKHLDNRSLTIHWYWDFAVHAATCLRELNLHFLKPIRSAKLEVNAFGEAPLPKDYVDYIRVLADASEVPVELVRYPEMNRMPNTDEDGNQIPYETLGYGNVGYSPKYIYWGEDVGGNFGYNGSSYNRGFNIIPERGIIKFTNGVCSANAVIDYIGDGTGCDAADRIHPYAQQSIEDFIDWATDPQQRGNWDAPKGRKYKRSLEWLRSSLDPFTVADAWAIFNNAEILAPR